MGIAMRSSSTSLPARSWYRPSALARPVTNTSLTLPPSLVAAARSGPNGISRISNRRRSDRSCITSERAASVTMAWRCSDESIRAASPARPGHLERVRDHVTGGPDGVPHDVDAPARGVDDRVACRGERRRRGGRFRPFVAGHRRGIALEVDERERQLESADTVGDRVVDLLQERGPAVAQPLDDRELPQRPGPVERSLRERAAEVEDRAVVARRGNRDDAHVRLQVERRVVGELGRRDAQRRADDALAQTRDAVERARTSVSRSRSSVGRASRNVRLQKSERSAGSFSTAHMIASAFDMRTEWSVRLLPADTAGRNCRRSDPGALVPP